MITTNPALLTMPPEDKENIKLVTITTSKRQTTRQRTRLNVTVCLFDKTKFLSMLMAEAVMRENPQKKKLKKVEVNLRIRQFPLAIPIKKAAKSG